MQASLYILLAAEIFAILLITTYLIALKIYNAYEKKLQKVDNDDEYMKLRRIMNTAENVLCFILVYGMAMCIILLLSSTIYHIYLIRR